MTDTALLVVDMLNAYRHDDADLLIPNVEAIVAPLADLLERADASADIDVVYINDNYGDFTAGRDDIVASALDGRRPDLVTPILPSEDSQFLIKVRHSAFYSTPLGYLLSRSGTRRVILTGQVTEQCVLYTALDAYVRHFDVVIPTDAVAHIDDELAAAALKMVTRNMGGQLVTAAQCAI